MRAFRFDPVELPSGVPALRREVRTFLADELGSVAARRRANSWSVFDAEFSRKLGARGWIGMVWPNRTAGTGAARSSKPRPRARGTR